MFRCFDLFFANYDRVSDIAWFLLLTPQFSRHKRSLQNSLLHVNLRLNHYVRWILIMVLKNYVSCSNKFDRVALDIYIMLWFCARYIDALSTKTFESCLAFQSLRLRPRDPALQFEMKMKALPAYSILSEWWEALLINIQQQRLFARKSNGYKS